MDFRNGQIKNLLSIDMLNEGIDVPDVSLIIFARITHSRKVFIQQLGRGLRVKNGKDKCIVLDFVADIRRIAEGYKLNSEAKNRSSINVEYYKHRSMKIVNFIKLEHNDFLNEYLLDVADLEDNDKITLKFPDIGEEN